jgi:hypothetical protein
MVKLGPSQKEHRTILLSDMPADFVQSISTMPLYAEVLRILTES